MANEVEKVNDLLSGVNSLNISEKQENGAHNGADQPLNNWGFPIEELYRLALKFYKGKLLKINCKT